MADLVTREDLDGIAVLMLNRPDVLNALSPSLFVELRGHVDAIAQAADEVGCVVLAGAGRSFCAGNDLKAIRGGEQAPSENFQAETVDAIAALPQPVIVAVQGHCYTGGLELALAGDLLIAADTAKFADTHGKWGMTPKWGMSQRLPRRVGLIKAKEMMFTGQPVDGAEAERIGLANRCVPEADLLTVAMDMASAIVANSWHTLRADKMLVDGGLDRGLTEGLRFELTESPGRADDFAERLKEFA